MPSTQASRTELSTAVSQFGKGEHLLPQPWECLHLTFQIGGLPIKQESCLVTTPEYLAWLAEGNTPLPADT